MKPSLQLGQRVEIRTDGDTWRPAAVVGLEPYRPDRVKVKLLDGPGEPFAVLASRVRAA